jgi:hypothetical protein
MKKITYLLSAMTLLFLAACDKVDGPYGVTVNNTDTTGTTIIRKVLLEDFTGHLCQNCPAAHHEADRLLGIYGNKLVVLDVHAGYYAKTQPPNYTADFRNPVSTAIATDFGIISLPFPTGMINRHLNSTGTNYDLDYANWEANVDSMTQRPADAGIAISNSFNGADSTMSCSIAVTMVNAYSNHTQLAVYFVEDSIIDWQKDNTLDVQFYVHKHMLRGSFNGTYGDDLGGNFTAGQTINESYSTKLTPNTANPNHVLICAVLTDVITKEVVQVEEKKLIP